jgi:hypothetical protein
MSSRGNEMFEASKKWKTEFKVKEAALLLDPPSPFVLLQQFFCECFFERTRESAAEDFDQASDKLSRNEESVNL